MTQDYFFSYVCPMPIDPAVSKKIAEQLLQIKAIKLQPEKPFTWASGWKSPIYCDNRLSLSYPIVRTYIRQALVNAIERNYGKPELIAGVATAAIAQGALVAEAMGLPFVYVRSSAKDHGRENLIEGETVDGQSVVVIEDLVSTGQSSLKAVQALRDAGCNVKGMGTVPIETGVQNLESRNLAQIKTTLVEFDKLSNDYIVTLNLTWHGYDTSASALSNPITKSVVGRLKYIPKAPIKDAISGNVLYSVFGLQLTFQFNCRDFGIPSTSIADVIDMECNMNFNNK